MSGVYGLMLIVTLLVLLLATVWVIVWVVFWRLGRRAGVKVHEYLWDSTNQDVTN